MKAAPRIAALSLCLALPLAAGCSDMGPDGRFSLEKAMNSHAREERLSTAAADAMARGRTQEALAQYRELHRRKPHDRDTALNYAQLLRRTGSARRALEVLAPFARHAGGQPPDPLVVTEMAVAHISLGSFGAAEELLNAVLEDQRARPYHSDARHLMGVALDAQGQHKEAELMFRLALEDWKGDPTSVMNNLALSLASQGMFDQSLTTLRQALVMAPEKIEIARNIEIVSELRAAVVPRAPVSLRTTKGD